MVRHLLQFECEVPSKVSCVWTFDLLQLLEASEPGWEKLEEAGNWKGSHFGICVYPCINIMCVYFYMYANRTYMCTCIYSYSSVPLPPEQTASHSWAINMSTFHCHTFCFLASCTLTLWARAILSWLSSFLSGIWSHQWDLPEAAGRRWWDCLC